MCAQFAWSTNNPREGQDKGTGVRLLLMRMRTLNVNLIIDDIVWTVRTIIYDLIIYGGRGSGIWYFVIGHSISYFVDYGDAACGTRSRPGV